MQTVELNATLRQGTGKQVTRKLRVAGQVPAVLYGSGGDPVSLNIPYNDVERVFRFRGGGSFLLDLSVDGAAPILSIIKEKQVHPVSGKLVHIDFLRISMDKPITVQVPVHLTGESRGVKDFGGIIDQPLRLVEISCLPADIPDEILVDISALDIGDSIHIADLPADKFTFNAESERTVVAVGAPRITLGAIAEGEAAAVPAEGEAAGGENEAEE
jgi:large subunit ribosomal protein L25